MPVSSSPGCGQYDLYGRWPRRSVVTDALPAAPLEWAKKQGVQDVAFAKKRGLKVPETLQLGLPATATLPGRHRRVHLVKRVFGLGAVPGRAGPTSSYVYLSIVSFNLRFWPACCCKRSLNPLPMPRQGLASKSGIGSNGLEFLLSIEPVYCSFSGLPRARLSGWLTKKSNLPKPESVSISRSHSAQSNSLNQFSIERNWIQEVLVSPAEFLRCLTSCVLLNS